VGLAVPAANSVSNQMFEAATRPDDIRTRRGFVVNWAMPEADSRKAAEQTAQQVYECVNFQRWLMVIITTR
jgi:hypothetical protein